ncbi:MAG: arginine repressor, partial [Limosilactobacillus fermentum]
IANRVVSYTTIEFVNVVKTTPDSSYATILGGMFDELSMPEVAGTIAGNDTLLIISPDAQGAQKIGQLLADNQGH